jgi:LCP family protein required for cell wall assembly
MSDISATDFFSRQAQQARGPEQGRPERRKTKRSKLTKRILLAAGLSLVVAGAAIVTGGYLAVNHLVSSVHRIHGIVALTALDKPVMPAVSRRSMTVLLTSSGEQPGQNGGGIDGASPHPAPLAGLISLVHLNASGHGGAVVSIPADAVVHLPGHGNMELWNALRIGGPSLLIQTIEQLTNVRIDHYSVLDFPGARSVVGAMGGVNVRVPYSTTSFGQFFHAGIDHLGAGNVLAYVRQPAVSELGREELQSNLIRAMLTKIANRHMFSHVTTDWRVVHALAAAMSVDSNFSNSQLESLALRLGRLSSRNGVFITTPTTGSPSTGGTGPIFLRSPASQLWRAIRTDSVASFARRFPSTVTPGAPG